MTRMTGTHRCLYLLLSFAFYIAVFVNTCGWHDAVRQQVSDLPPWLSDFTLHPSLASMDIEQSWLVQDIVREVARKNKSPRAVRKAVAEKEEQLPVDTKSTAAPQPEVTLSESITPDNPVFVWSLPNSGGLALQRYFRCAGLNETTLGRLWTQEGLYDKDLWKRIPVGQCMEQNVHQGRDILEGCGGYRVWTEMEYVSKGTPREIAQKGRTCSFPTLRPGFMTRILQAYPNATVLNVVRDPEEWYDTLSAGEKERWPRYCNKNPSVYKFPQANATKQEWVQFYKRHTQLVRNTVVEEHPSVKFLEVDLDMINGGPTADTLNEHLGIPQHCWTHHAVTKELPKDIGYPIFVPSLPKSATSTVQKYLNCGMGYHEGAHQWTQREGSVKNVRIGDCMRENMQRGRPIVEDCGDHKHWSDIGVITQDDCFYPSMHNDGLQAMYEAHPYGTILNAVRDPLAWYQSARKWENLNLRWAKKCKGFPSVEATEQEWIEFYDWHTNRIREFARKHPTMNYVEIYIHNATETRQILEDNFGFPGRCWGHKNNNANNQAVEMRMQTVQRNKEKRLSGSTQTQQEI